jgi:hypothetical protein
MDSGNNKTGGMAMETTNGHSAHADWDPAGSKTRSRPEEMEGTRMGARLLILAGIVMQLAMFGFGLLGHGTVLLVSGLASGAWSILASLWSMPLESGLSECWPLMLVAAGLAILWSTKRNGARAGSARQKGDGHGE